MKKYYFIVSCFALLFFATCERNKDFGPVISLIGEDSISLRINTVYEEFGATAIDDVDGRLPFEDLIIDNGDFDNQKIGEFGIEYKYTDSDENESVAIREIFVFAETADFFGDYSGIQICDEDSVSFTTSILAIGDTSIFLHNITPNIYQLTGNFNEEFVNKDSLFIVTGGLDAETSYYQNFILNFTINNIADSLSCTYILTQQ